MKARLSLLLVLLLLTGVLLAGCSGAPSNKEAKYVVYAVYFKDARILEKTACEITPEMEAEGHTNVWLIRYRLEGARSDATLPLTEVDGEWQIYVGNPDCP